MFRFLPSIFALQIVLAVTVYAASRNQTLLAVYAVGIFIIVSSVLFSFWLKTLAELRGKDEIARHKEQFAKEREELRVKAEKEKLKVVRDTHKQVSKDATRTQAKANFKVGAAVAGAIGVGALLVVSQLLTLGLLTLTTAGGGLAGYLVRARQDKKRLAYANDTALKQSLPKPKVINALGFEKKKSG